MYEVLPRERDKDKSHKFTENAFQMSRHISLSLGECSSEETETNCYVISVALSDCPTGLGRELENGEEIR